MKKYLLHNIIAFGAIFTLLFLSFLSIKTASAQSMKTNWISEAFGQNDFIENKGQFNGMNGIDSDILFGATGSTVDVYFSSKGLTYRYDDWVEMTERETE